ncbi:MAG: hypothetical protein IBX63_11630, partial [Coriobacteriia bacterium]|nr:hypothetical protein [Coriobacteriia bacterium]
STPEVFKDTRLLKPSDDGASDACLDDSLEVLGTKALHEDVSRRAHHHGYDSIGVIVKIKGVDDETPALVGLPSDTKYSEEVVRQYEGCSVVCVHIGSITPRNFKLVDYFLEEKTCEEVLARKQHLYLPGAFWFIMRLMESPRVDMRAGGAERGRRDRLVVLSEFGEEMSGGLRIDLAGKLDSWARDRDPKRLVRVVPGDVGLVVDPVRETMLCSCCEQYYPWSTELKCESSGDSEQIFYVCPSCRTVLSQDDRTTIFRRKQTPLMRMTRP